MKFLVSALTVLLLVGGSGVAFAVIDSDNNGIAGDETFVPQTYSGNPDRATSVAFPTSLDTFAVTFYPYWWNTGDTVYGTHSVDEACVCHADVALKISYNVLNSGGYVDLDFRINGTTVGSFRITEADGTGYVYGSFDFPAQCGRLELRYYETNTVAPGAGSISLDESGLSSVTFTACATATESTTWGTVKSIYR